MTSKPQTVPAQSVHLQLPADLFAQVERARGDVPRNAWIRRAIQQRLDLAITDELLDRAWNAGQADLPNDQREARQWDKPALRAALRAALRVITERAPAL